MIIKLNFTNKMPAPVLVRSNMASGQPLAPNQQLEMTFEMQPGEDGVADLTIICEPDN